MSMSSKFHAESTDEKIVKIGQYLAKIWSKYDSLVFFGPPCILLLLPHVHTTVSVCNMTLDT